MAISYRIKNGDKSPVSTILLRYRTRNGIDLERDTKIEVDVKSWYKAQSSVKSLDNYKKTAEGEKVYKILDQISKDLDSHLQAGTLNSKTFKDVIFFRTHEEEVLARRAEEEEEAKRKAKEEEDAKKITLNQYYGQFIADIKSGARKTEEGGKFSPDSIKRYNQGWNRFQEYQKSRGKNIDFDDINLKFYHDYTKFLFDEKQYSRNTVGCRIKELKQVIRSAHDEEITSSTSFDNKKMKAFREETDAVYLELEEIKKMNEVKLDNLPEGYRIARDIFMVGIWTAQRISDYNDIKPENIKTETQKYIKDDDTVGVKEITYIDLIQKKTSTRVQIPCNEELRAILAKYNNNLPHISDQKLNAYIKEIACLAKIDEPVTVRTTKGGEDKKETLPKCQLVHSHTARRTGTTLMYLSGMPYVDIMKVTGHSSVQMLKTYIREKDLKNAEKLSGYDYFK